MVARFQHPLCHADRAVARGARWRCLGPAGALALCDRAPRGDHHSLSARDLSVRDFHGRRAASLRPFGENRIAGKAIEQAILADPAPAYCLRLDTNVFFYVHVPLRCLDLQGMAALDPPAWLLMPHAAVAEFAKLRPDLNVRTVKDGLTEHQFTAARIEKK